MDLFPANLYLEQRLTRGDLNLHYAKRVICHFNLWCYNLALYQNTNDIHDNQLG